MQGDHREKIPLERPLKMVKIGFYVNLLKSRLKDESHFLRMTYSCDFNSR